MSQITLNIENRYLSGFLKFLKTLKYIEVKKVKKDAETEMDEASKKATLNALYGAWKDEGSAEEIIEGIQASRSFTRTIETL